MAKQNTIGTKLVTPEFRSAFVNVFSPSKNQQGKDIYSLVMLFDKKTDVSGIKAAVKDLIDKVYPDPAKRPAFKNPFRDGDIPNSAGNIFDGYEGTTYIRAWSANRPGIVDGNVQDILDPKEFYAGCYARATIVPFIFNNSGNTGVSFFLNNIQKMRDGENLGGGAANAADDFAPIPGAPPSGQTVLTGLNDDMFL